MAAPAWASSRRPSARNRWRSPRTKDHGSTWAGSVFGTTLRTPPLLAGTGIQDIQVDPSNSSTVYVVTNGQVGTAGAGRVWRSTDSGYSWTDVSAGLPLSDATGSV